MARKSKRIPKTAIASLPAKSDAAAVAEVFLWMVQGHTERHILEAMRNFWPDQNAEPIIATAVKQLIESANFDRNVMHGWCFEAYRDLYRRMIEVGDFAGALRAVKHLEEMAR